MKAHNTNKYYSSWSVESKKDN